MIGMDVPEMIQGFSRLSRGEKATMVASCTHDPAYVERQIKSHLMADEGKQKVYDEFSENVVSNFYLPYSIAPNFRINDRYYFVPMVTEESSVVAAASAAAKFWAERGGFHARVESMIKPGHVHFVWKGDPGHIREFIDWLKPGLLDSTSSLTHSMRDRGGGILGIQLKDLSDRLEGYYQLEVLFNTADSMGANFINSCLERMAAFLIEQAETAGISDSLQVIMSILSNFTPQCTVTCSVTCHPDQLTHLHSELNGFNFARKFELAVNMARMDPFRAVTHNKGILNGVEAVITATGNDSRAVEAGVHAYASRDGMYRGLTRVDLDPGSFTFGIEMPMNIGTAGGITRLHPLADVSMKILGDPGASELMSVAAAAGLASNFSAVRSLITSGIQKGHMRMHLSNMLNQHGASDKEKQAATDFFRDKPVTHTAVREFISRIRHKP